MKVLVLDIEAEGTALDIALRAQDAGHEVKYWQPTHKGEALPYGEGLIERPKEWEPLMDWGDLIILNGNSKYATIMAEYFGKGYPIFGTNAKAAELELDRGVGQAVLKEYGVKTAPYEVVTSPEEGISLIKETGKAYAMKPWGGDGDKSMTYVSRTPDDGIFTLERWKKLGKFKGSLMLQEKIEGVEMGISGFFGPGGWCEALEESFEHKKFMNDDLGENTGEMGTVIRHVTKSKLFETVLEPLTDYLHKCNYVGDASVNCIIDKRGTAWPLEFTMRLGWPDFCIRQGLVKGDPVQWMLDLLDGYDTLEVSSEIAVGVLITHGDFPRGNDPVGTWAGFPIYGITEGNKKNLHFQQVMYGKAPKVMGGKVKEVPYDMTAGNYVLVVSGCGGTVEKARNQAYKLANEIKLPSNLMMRTDIGKRLEVELPLIQSHGYAKGMKYG